MELNCFRKDYIYIKKNGDGLNSCILHSNVNEHIKKILTNISHKKNEETKKKVIFKIFIHNHDVAETICFCPLYVHLYV